MRWQSILATTAISAALAGYILFTRDNDEALTDVPAPAQPGYYLKQATITETGPDGNARMRLQAGQIAQSTGDNSILLQQVSVSYRSNDNRTWLLTADHGQMHSGTTQVDFNGNVHIRPETPVARDAAAPDIHTDTLSIDTVQNIAHAPGMVRIAFGPHQLTATGLNFDFARQILRLESDINGQFR